MADEAVLDVTDLGADTGSQDDGTQDDVDVSATDDSQDIADDAATDDSESEAEVADDEAPEELVEEVAPDGRKMPDSLKKGIAALKASMPEVAKEVKGLFFANQEYRSVFAKPADAVAAKTLIDEVGGQEGIQEIHAEREEWRQIDTNFSEGKPEFVKSLAEGNPEAFLKTAPHVINEFAQRAPEQYAYYANQVSINTLASAGITLQGLSTAYERYKDNPQAQAVIAEVHNALFDLKEKSTKFEEKRSSVDPEREKFQSEKAQFEQQRRADFETGVANQAETHLKEKMQPEIDRIINGRKVDAEAMKGFQTMVQQKVMEKLAAIPGFEAKLESFYRTGDAKKSIEYITARYNQILPEAAKVIEPYLRNISPGLINKAKPAAGTTAARAAAPGEVTLKEMPEWHQLDPAWRARPESTAELMMGNAVLKGGKKASGWA